MKHLTFRHLHIHGYGYMLAWEKIKPLAESISETAERFFVELAKDGYK